MMKYQVSRFLLEMPLYLFTIVLFSYKLLCRTRTSEQYTEVAVDQCNVDEVDRSSHLAQMADKLDDACIWLRRFTY